MRTKEASCLLEKFSRLDRDFTQESDSTARNSSVAICLAILWESSAAGIQLKQLLQLRDAESTQCCVQSHSAVFERLYSLRSTIWSSHLARVRSKVDCCSGQAGEQDSRVEWAIQGFISSNYLHWSEAATEVMGNRLTSPINLAIDSKGHQRTRGIAVEIPHSRASKHSIHIQQNTPMVLYQVESTG